MSSHLLFKRLEGAEQGTSIDFEELLTQVKWNAAGLVPAIAQQHDSGEVLMMAWMNEMALRETLTSGRVCYWSRSRGKFWRKGESSGQQQQLVKAALDCDGDTLLIQVDQSGPACHSGRRSCFYVSLDSEQAHINSDPLIDPAILYGEGTKS